MESIITLEKPKPKVADSDWHGKIFQLRHSCDTRRHFAFDLKNESRQLRNESDIRSHWETYHNDARLADRITEVSRWTDALNKCSSQIQDEIHSLTLEKALTEKEIELYNLNFTVVNECLTLRDERTSNDLCRDAVERELQQELRSLETFKRIFTDKVQEAWEQVSRLQDTRYKIQCDVQDKQEGRGIDQHCLGLDKQSAGNTLKHNALKSPHNVHALNASVLIGSPKFSNIQRGEDFVMLVMRPNPGWNKLILIPHEAWLENAKYLKERGESEVRCSEKLRESIVLPRDQSHNELCAQNERTNYVMRQRIYETMKIRNELDWQKSVLIPDKEKLLAEVRQLECNMADLARRLRLAETRSEARLSRPGLELVRDGPYEGLCEEIQTLRSLQRLIQDKLVAARTAVNALDDQLSVIQAELATKTRVLELERRCLGLRDRLAAGPRCPPATETDRNVVLTNLADQIPPEPKI